MSQFVTLELPDKVAYRAQEIAARTQRRLEDVLVEWLDQALAEPPVEALADDEVLALCELQMAPQQNDELSELLARSREGAFEAGDQRRLDELMQVYRRGLVRKAQAIKVAVERGLRSPLTESNGS